MVQPGILPSSQMLSSFTGKAGQIAAKSVETRKVNKTFYLVAFCVESLVKDNTGFGAIMNKLHEGVFFLETECHICSR